MDYQQMTSPCGLGCFNCPVYLANEDEKLRAVIAERFGIREQEAVCQGCRNEGDKIAFLGMTEPCNVYRCIGKKGLQFCCDCSDFPCDHLHPYADQASQKPHNTKVFNLCLIKKMGLDAWAKDKAKGVRDTYFKHKFKL
jgi:hypothetical protein